MNKLLPCFLVTLLFAVALESCDRAPQSDAIAAEKFTSSEELLPGDIPGFVYIPSCELSIGDALDETKSAPLTNVSVDGYYIQTTEVTGSQWTDIRGWGLKHGYSDLVQLSEMLPNHPASMISWHDAVKWCNAKSEKEGLVPCYYVDVVQSEIYRTGKRDIHVTMVNWKSDGYRLPTEAEWEIAARGGLSGKRFPWGNHISLDLANYYNAEIKPYSSGRVGYANANPPFTSPVGSFKPNGFGLHDVAGNVWEWCWDWYGVYPTGRQTNPRGADNGSDRVVRGGSWSSDAIRCGVAYRYHAVPEGIADIGFRTARTFNGSQTDR